MRAENANQALRKNGLQRGRNQIRFNPHIHQSRKRPRGVIGVESAENQMSRQRGLHGNLRRFLVTNFTNEDHVRIMPQNGPQPASKGQPGFFRDLNLVDAAQLIFDRILDGDDLANIIVDLI